MRLFDPSVAGLHIDYPCLHLRVAAAEALLDWVPSLGSLHEVPSTSKWLELRQKRVAVNVLLGCAIS